MNAMKMMLKVIFEEIKGYQRFIKFLIVLVLAAAVAGLVRLVFGLGATTNLNDLYPWGLWISFDVVTAVPLAAGAFTIGVVPMSSTSRSWSRWCVRPSSPVFSATLWYASGCCSTWASPSASGTPWSTGTSTRRCSRSPCASWATQPFSSWSSFSRLPRSSAGTCR